MQIDQTIVRQAARLAPRLLARHLRAGPAEAPAAPKAAARDGLRGSGSWANEWTGGDSAPAVRARPLMTEREVRLHNWIADRLEVETPTATLHAGVALAAFLHSDAPGALDGLVADMVIVDEAGRPVAALLRERRADPATRGRITAALAAAGVAHVDLPDRLSLSRLWAEIADTLDHLADADAVAAA
ncbi:hypothetical protein [Jannaschia sp. W003]|uniref:hypothetical protein n=1 Tax=Jannaschia sp. W003 TaxID=2867012 RepID=UPI0021A456C1|nr:hypothetical protein [Jannaschia sp. W003]UWQ22504.1 hypothetical protein K3554_05625 [Jannaschia sp. W003]